MRLEINIPGNLEKKIKDNLNPNGLKSVSSARLMHVLMNTFGCFDEFNSEDRGILGRVILQREAEELDLAYRFARRLLFEVYGIEKNVPEDYNDEGIIRVRTYMKRVEELFNLHLPTNSHLHNKTTRVLQNFRKDGRIPNNLIGKPLNMWSYRHYRTKNKRPDVLGFDMRVKPVEDYIMKALVNLAALIDYSQRSFRSSNGEEINGMEIAREFMQRSKGEDLYSFLNRENPQYLLGDELFEFKSKFRSIHSRDRVGVKFLFRTRKDLNDCLSEISRRRYVFGEYRLLEAELQDDRSQKKDNAVTVPLVGGGDTRTIVEVKLITAADEINAAFGQRAHVEYKSKKYGDTEIRVLRDGVLRASHEALNRYLLI